MWAQHMRTVRAACLEQAGRGAIVQPPLSVWSQGEVLKPALNEFKHYMYLQWKTSENISCNQQIDSPSAGIASQDHCQSPIDRVYQNWRGGENLKLIDTDRADVSR